MLDIDRKAAKFHTIRFGINRSLYPCMEPSLPSISTNNAVFTPLTHFKPIHLPYGFFNCSLHYGLILGGNTAHQELRLVEPSLKRIPQKFFTSFAYKIKT